MRLISATLVALAAMLVTAKPLAAALVVIGYQAETAGKYDRFANAAAFIGSAYDWSGVGKTSSDRWGVLISPSFVLSSRHHAPSKTDNIRFYESNDPNGGYVERSIVSSTVMANSDLILTQLGEATTGVATYAIGHPATNLVGEELLVWGRASHPDPFLNMRLGRNEVLEVMPGFSSPAELVGQGDVFIYDYDTTAAGLGADEARIDDGDSGGPSFIVGPGGPVLVGVHWFKYDAELPNYLEGSGDTLVTSYINEINSAMAAAGSSEFVTVAVPEPGALGLVIAGLSVVLVRRRQPAAG